MSSQQVFELLEWLSLLCGPPSHQRGDNWLKFIDFTLQQWLRDRHCKTLYTTPGSPRENPFIEHLNGTQCTIVLDRWLFADGHEAESIIE